MIKKGKEKQKTFCKEKRSKKVIMGEDKKGFIPDINKNDAVKTFKKQLLLVEHLVRR